MGRLLERVERQPPAGMRDRGIRLSGRLERRHEPVEGALELRSQLSGGVALPVVEADAVAEPEAGEQVVAVERHGGGERGDRARAVAGTGHEPAEPADVDRIRLGVEPHRRAADRDPALPEGRAQRGERAPERRASAIGIRVRPQQIDEQVAALRAGPDGQVGEQRHGLARVHPQRLAVHLDLRSPQHVDAERHSPSMAPACVTVKCEPFRS